MTSHFTLITRKGQVTIPVEIRRSLGLKEGDRVRFVQEGDRISLEPIGSVVERSAAIGAKYGREGSPPTLDELKRAFEAGVAAEVKDSLARESESDPTEP